MAGVINKVKAKVEEVLHKDNHHNTTATHTGTHPHTTGTHTGTHTGGLGSSTHSTNAGPHSSNAANALDPRVDSDRDGSNTVGAGGYGTTHNTHGTSGFGSNTHGTSGLGSNTHGNSTNAGPHSSNIANKLDPRVDSDRDGSNTAGGYGSASHNTHGGLGSSTHNTHGTTGLGSNTHGHSTNAGPHSSNIANKLDPRVDSDRDGSTTAPGYPNQHAGGIGSTTHGTTGHTGAGFGGVGSQGYSTNQGPHSSNVANKLDPRVDSDRDGSTTAPGYPNQHAGGIAGLGGNNHTTNHGAGLGGIGTQSHNTTAGPHSSNLANKLDPRVDSDRDGSTTAPGYPNQAGHAGGY